MEIAVVNESATLGDSDVAFMVAACAQQAEELCLAWSLPFVPVAFYAKGTSLSPKTTHAMVLTDSLNEPGALGYHSDDGGVIYGRVQAQGIPATGITLSHECCELIVDPTCDQWCPMPDGRKVAKETSDPVEGDSYVESVTVLGETRGIALSNYILPSWLEADGKAPFDRMSRCLAPFAMTDGGYLIVRDEHGDVSNVFAGYGPPMTFGRKLTNARSRTLRRLRGQ